MYFCLLGVKKSALEQWDVVLKGETRLGLLA